MENEDTVVNQDLIDRSLRMYDKSTEQKKQKKEEEEAQDHRRRRRRQLRRGCLRCDAHFPYGRQARPAPLEEPQQAPEGEASRKTDASVVRHVWVLGAG